MSLVHRTRSAICHHRTDSFLSVQWRSLVIDPSESTTTDRHFHRWIDRRNLRVSIGSNSWCSAYQRRFSASNDEPFSRYASTILTIPSKEPSHLLLLFSLFFKNTNRRKSGFFLALRTVFVDAWRNSWACILFCILIRSTLDVVSESINKMKKFSGRIANVVHLISNKAC